MYCMNYEGHKFHLFCRMTHLPLSFIMFSISFDSPRISPGSIHWGKLLQLTAGWS